MSSGYGHLACRWLVPAVFCAGHGPLQFPAEVWRASRAFYTQHTNDPSSPPAHTDSDTNRHPLVNTYTYKNIHMHTNMNMLTQVNTKHTHNSSTLFLSSVHYYDTWMHNGTVHFYFLPALTKYTHKLERKNLKHTTESWKWPYPTWAYYKPILASLSLSIPFFFFFFYDCFAQIWKR